MSISNIFTEIDSEKLISVKTRQYSDSISKRRKALFKNEELKTHSSHAADLEDMDLIESFKPLEINDVSICTHSNENDYLILETIDLKCLNQSSFKNDTHIIVNPSTEGNVSSPTKILADETPNKISPTEKLKTPNDVSSSAKGVVPKLIRKSLLDNSFKDTVKRKIDSLSPSSKDLEILPSKISKIRTALFPDDNIGLPTKSFYPKPVNNTIKKIHVPSSTSTKRIRHKTGNSFLCNRNKKGRKYLGQINAGVRHNILKPRKKPLKKEAILKAAINIIDNSPLNEYLSNATNQIGQIDSVENVIPIAQSHSKNDKMLNETENKTETFVVKIHKDSGNKKRSHSPSNMDEKRKFFKSSRPKIITVDKRLNIEVQPEEKDPVNVKDNSDLFDFTTFTEFDYGSSIDNILSTLEDKENKESNNVNSNCNNIVNNLPDKNINLMSPTSEMCNRTLSLALNSPKKAKLDINKILENPISQNVFNKPHSLEAMENKYYSIFNMKNKVETEAPITLPNKNITANKKWKSLPKNQMLLDAGQKKFGITQCPECNTVYHMGDPNDEIMHLNNHNATNVLKFNVSIFYTNNAIHHESNIHHLIGMET